jgi:hypothetical protein
MQVDVVEKSSKSTKKDYMVIDHEYDLDIKTFKNKMVRNNIDTDVINNFINDYNSKYLTVKKLGGIYNLKLWSDSILA